MVANPMLTSAALLMLLSMLITEAMAPHRPADRWLSHGFRHSAPLVLGFAAGAAGLWASYPNDPFVQVVAVAVALVPVTELLRGTLGRAGTPVHVASAAVAFGGALLAALVLADTTIERAIVALSPVVVLLTHAVWRSTKLMEKAAAYWLVLWMLVHGVGW